MYSQENWVGVGGALLQKPLLKIRPKLAFVSTLFMTCLIISSLVQTDPEGVVALVNGLINGLPKKEK